VERYKSDPPLFICEIPQTSKCVQSNIVGL